VTWDERKVNGRDSCEVITARNALSNPRNTFIIGPPSSFSKPRFRIEQIVGGGTYSFDRIYWGFGIG
jgi:hypothetical protein